ncbi:MAG: efflux RND transporter periplasmic adaptor subunit [Deltaproteobacteria bacterium]
MAQRFFKYIILSVLVLNACKKQVDSAAESKSEEQVYYAVLSDQQLSAGSIKTDKYKLAEFTEIVNVSGNIEIPPSSQFDVSPLFPGIIRGINLMLGQKVEKNQVLFSIESTDLITLQQDFVSIGEQLVYLKNDYERQLALFKENVNSEKKYLKAESDYKSQLATYNGIKKKLQLLGINLSEVTRGEYKSSYKVIAPISGIVASIEKVNGSFVSATETVLKLVNSQEAHLSLNVFENDIHKLKEGQKVIFTTADGMRHNAAIHLISPTINPVNKAVEVHADIIGKIRYPGNTFVTAKIFSGVVRRNSFPINALLSEGEENFVLVLDKKENGKNYFVKFPVKLNYKDDHNFSFEEIETLNDKNVLTEGGIMLQKEE